MNFFAELKRRHIYRVAAAYAVVAWLLLQLVNNVAPVLDLPVWVARAFLLALVIGFPIAVLLAWIVEASPSNAIKKGTTTAAPASSSTKPDWIVAGAFIVVIALVFYQQLAPSRAPTRQADVLSGSNAPTGISLAVLPFVNLSSDKEQEFFSDGMTEEITSALAKVSGLNVVARTSAFQFKGENRDVQSIAQALHATHLIEGSVRKDGSEVRITAQLIRADNGTHLWTESYDRELKGVFAIQEEIATAIATSLRVPLGLKQGQNLVSNRTSDTDSYQDYLRARALVRSRAAIEPGGPLTEAANLLEQVVARDPSYAPAWGLLGQAYALTPFFTTAVNNGSTLEIRRTVGALMQKAEAAAEKATQLDPDNVDGYSALGLVREFGGKFAQAEDLYKRALSLDPGNPEALHRYGAALATIGRFKDALPMRLRLQAQEPLVPIYNQITAYVLWLNGRSDEAIAILKASPPTFIPRLHLANIYVSMGHSSEAADVLREIPSGLFLQGALQEAIRFLRSAPAQAASSRTVVSSGALGFVYLSIAPDRVLDYYEGLAEAGYPAIGGYAEFLWAPADAPVRKTQRFKVYARNAGLVDYWKARGWPDLCHPVGADDFMCE